jgi:hypothetical protein
MLQTIMQWLGVVERPAQLGQVDLFLAGHSIPAISASAGQDMIAEQRRIEAKIRAYIIQLETEISELQGQP